MCCLKHLNCPPANGFAIAFTPVLRVNHTFKQGLPLKDFTIAICCTGNQRRGGSMSGCPARQRQFDQNQNGEQPSWYHYQENPISNGHQVAKKPDEDPANCQATKRNTRPPSHNPCTVIFFHLKLDQCLCTNARNRGGEAG